MCFEKILDLIASLKPKLPYPEEAEDLSRTADNTSILALRCLWYAFYGVPEEYHPFWDSVKINLVDDLHVEMDMGGWKLSQKVLEATYAELERIDIDPHSANIGVLAHSMAHISRTFLTESQKIMFEVAFDRERKTNKTLRYAWETKSYMHQMNDLNNPAPNYVEAHGDAYRYCGLIPNLKEYYPKL